MNRTLKVARVQLSSWPRSVGLAWAVVLLVFLALIAAYGLTGAGDHGSRHSTAGAIASIFMVHGVVAYQAVSQYFPFLSGLGVTRRTFWAGSTMVLAVESVSYALVLALLGAVESATRGWGVGAWFFAPFDLGGAPGRWGVYTVLFLLTGACRLLAGAAVKRWGVTALLVGGTAVGLGLIVVILGIFALVGFGRAASGIGGLPPAVTLGLVPLAVAAVAGVLGWTVLRRAVP